MTVHSTRGVQSEAHLPFAGLHQLLAALLPRLDELGAVQQRHLLVAFGLEEAESADPFRIALAALELLTNAASDGPLLLVADDAQLLDAPTIDVLTFVARRLAADPIVALFAVRGEAITDSGLDELRLAPLDDAASAALLRTARTGSAAEHGGARPPGGGGQPARARGASGGAAIDRSRTLGPPPDLLPLTARLERAFAARVDELPAETRALLLAAAIDPSCGLRELLRAAGSVVGHALSVEAIDAAAEVGLVDVDATAHVHFRHPLMASAIHGTASFAERVRVHEALADALDHQLDKQLWHRASAAVGIDESLSGELEQSAARALQRGAPAMGVSRLRRAAELTADPARRGSLLLRAAELAGELGQRGVAAELASLADLADMGPVERARLVAVGEIVALGDLSDAGRLRSLIRGGGRGAATPVPETWPSTCSSGRRPGASGEALRTRPELRSSPRSSAPGSRSGDPRRLAILRVCAAGHARRRGAATARRPGPGSHGRDGDAFPGRRGIGARRLSLVERAPRRRCGGVPRRGPARAARPRPRDSRLGPDLARRLGPGPRRSGRGEPAGGGDGRAVLGDHRDGRQGHARRTARRQRSRPSGSRSRCRPSRSWPASASSSSPHSRPAASRPCSRAEPTRRSIT